MSERRQLAVLLAPYVLGLSLLVAAPALVTFALSVTEYDLVGAPSFVGLDNYRELLEDDVFRIAVMDPVGLRYDPGLPERLPIACNPHGYRRRRLWPGDKIDAREAKLQ